MPGHSLDPTGLVELKPSAYGDWPASIAFATCLAVRHQHAGRPRAFAAPSLLWGLGPGFAAEHGRFHGPGFASLGLPPATLMTVEAQRTSDLLWALEESLRSGALDLVVGLVREVGLTPSRRLGLAATAGGTPALLLTHPRTGPALAAGLRLRVARLPSTPHPLDPLAPGAPRFRLTLERCRGSFAGDERKPIDVEWCHVAHSFHLATGLADRASRAAGTSAASSR